MKRTFTKVLALILVLCMLPLPVFAASDAIDLTEVMAAETYSNGTVSLPYRIYYPTGYDAQGRNPVPVLMFLHGAGERGTDNTAHISIHGGLISQIIQRDDCVVIAPQCPTTHKWVDTDWTLGSYDSDVNTASAYLEAAEDLLESEIAKGGIDAERVWAAGISMGGYGTWNLIMNNPELYTAAIPICGGADPNKASALLDMPIWTFHGTADATVPISGTVEMVNAIQAAGGTNLIYTQYEGATHGKTWQKAYVEPALIPWLYGETIDELIVEAESASPAYAGTWNETTTEKGAGSTTEHGSFTFVQATSADNQSVTFDLNVAEAGEYVIYTTTKDNIDRGIFQFSVNDSDVGDPVDLYYEKADGIFREHKIGTAVLAAGTNKLTATLMGRSTDESNYHGGAFDYFRLAPVKEHESTILNNEDTAIYSETEGTWADVDSAGQDGSAVRQANGGAAGFSCYPPATGKFEVHYYIPAGDMAETIVSISTLDGMWRYTIPEDTQSGWYRLGVVAATEGAAFALTVSSEGTVYADAVKLTQTSDTVDATYDPTIDSSEAVAVLVNQIGYDNGASMRATVPNAADGTKFQVINAVTQEVAYEGTVEDNIADFTGRITTEADTDFYITCAGARSYTFTIGTDLIYRSSVENALAFMSETRSDAFCYGSNSIGWRDSHQFSFELNGLVLQYMANPALYDNMDYQIYKVDSCEYEQLRVQDEPALIWLIQFAALRYYDWGCIEGRDLHALTKEQLAYYLYIYPEISEYVDRETYENIRDYTISAWGVDAVSSNSQWYSVSGTNHDLYSLQTVFGGLKGSQPPGHSIVPNLMMYEVAKRDGLGEEVAQRFFDAAYDNCEYLVGDEFDLNDPFYNKGQRMSEYITIPALSYFLEMYPDKAPEGLREAIESWAEKTIARSENMWDMRMAVSMAAGDGVYSFHNPSLTGTKLTQDYWTGAAYANADKQSEYLSGGAPKNEPGNQAGLQAVTYAAARVLDDGETSQRLQELGVAAIDDLFGRNPSGRAAFYDFTRDFEGGDLGWYKTYGQGAGMLLGCTAVIDANAPEGCYPYNPDAYDTGYTEGWVSYNTAWNASIAYAAADSISLSVSKTSGRSGDEITIILDAPINLDTEKQETGYVLVTNQTTGETGKVLVTEENNSSSILTGTYTLPADADAVVISYGYSLFEQAVEVSVENITPAAEQVMEMISAIGEVDAGSAEKIDAAREAYDALSDGEKAMVSNYETLEEAEAAYLTISQANEKAQAARAAAEEARKAAEDAQTKADAAKRKAEEADAAAGADKSKAEQANKEAQAAQAAADEAKKAAEDAAAAAELAQKAAQEANVEAAASAALAADYAKEVAQKNQAVAGLKLELVEQLAQAQQTIADTEKAQQAAQAVQEAALASSKYQALMELTMAADNDGHGAPYTEILKSGSAAIQAAQTEEEVAQKLAEAKASIQSAKVCPSGKFEDVESDGWYHTAVDNMVEKGYMQGVSDTLFDVNGTVTRAQLVTILYRIAGSPNVAQTENPFADVDAGLWYTDAVIWAADQGIVKGITERSFAPNAAITREQITTILFRMAEAAAVQEDLSAYADAASVSAYAKDAMGWAVSSGLIQGEQIAGKTYLSPKDPATRAQIAAILVRYSQMN